MGDKNELGGYHVESGNSDHVPISLYPLPRIVGNCSQRMEGCARNRDVQSPFPNLDYGAVVDRWMCLLTDVVTLRRP